MKIIPDRAPLKDLQNTELERSLLLIIKREQEERECGDKKSKNGFGFGYFRDWFWYRVEEDEFAVLIDKNVILESPRVACQLFESARAVLDPLGRISRAPKLQTALDSSSGLRIRRFSSRFQVIF